MKSAVVIGFSALLAAAGCTHHGGHHRSHKHHPYTHDSRANKDQGFEGRAAQADPAPSRDYTETYSAPAAPATRYTYTAPQPAVTYSAPQPSVTYSTSQPAVTYSTPTTTSTYTSTQTYTASPASTYTYSAPQSYAYTAAPVSEAAQTGPDTHSYALGDTCMGRHANSSGPLVGNKTGGTRYTCSGGPVATSGGVSYAAPAYNYSYSSSVPSTSSYSAAQGSTYSYTYVPGQPSTGSYGSVTDPKLQGGPDAPSIKPYGK